MTDKKALKINVTNLSKFSSALMGIAALMVIVCHSSPYISLPGALEQKLGYYHGLLGMMGAGGVRIFFFMSAVRLYFSMSKNDDLKYFYKKRLVRLLIPYFILAITGSVVNHFVLKSNDFAGFFADYFLYGYFTGSGSTWFIAAIVPMYIVYPFMFRLRRKYKYFSIFSFAIWTAVTCFVFYAFPGYFATVKNAILGVYAYLLGLELAPYVYEKRKISAIPYIAAIVLYSILNFGLDIIGHSYTGILAKILEVTLPIALAWVIALLLEKLPDGWNKVLSFFGGISLEMYLLGSIAARLKQLGFYDLICRFEPTGILFYAIASVLIVLMAYGVSKLINFLVIKRIHF